MDRNQALSQLKEAADLIGMIEDLTHPTAVERLSAASLSGLRITLKRVKESIISTHNLLATPQQESPKPAPAAPAQKPAEASSAKRHNLRSSLERFVERNQQVQS